MIDWLETPVLTHYQASSPSIVTRMINRPTPSIKISKFQTSVIIINAWYIRTIALQIDWRTAAGIKVKLIDRSICSEVFLKRLRAIIYSRITRSTKMAEILQIMLRGVGLSRLAIIAITASYSKAQRSTTSSTSSSTIVIRMSLKMSEGRPWMSVESSITKRSRKNSWRNLIKRRVELTPKRCQTRLLTWNRPWYTHRVHLETTMNCSMKLRIEHVPNKLTTCTRNWNSTSTQGSNLIIGIFRWHQKYDRSA